jgi:hypothetical protein
MTAAPADRQAGGVPLLDDWDDAPLATATARPLPPVTVLLDPHDDASITAALLAAHDPAAGRVTVHPTPAASSPSALACDLLAALGRPVARLAEEHISGTASAWQAAAAWIAGDQISQLAVLRAHRLALPGWQRLLELRRATGTRLVLAWHDRALSRDVTRLLADVPHRVSRTVADVAGTGASMTNPAEPFWRAEGNEPGPELAAALPPLPAADVAWFRAEAYRRLPAGEFARVDAVYAEGLNAACHRLVGHPEQRAAEAVDHGHYLRTLFPDGLRPAEITAGIALLEHRYPTYALRNLAGGLLCGSNGRTPRRFPMRWGDTAALQLFLSEMAAASPSRRHSIARLRGAQAGFLLHGLLLTLPDDLDDAGGPGLTGLPFTTELASCVRAGVASPVHAAALTAALFTGLDPPSLAAIPVSALSEDGTALIVPFLQDQRTWPGAFFVPKPARPLLRAARAFLHLRGTPPTKPLLSGGIGPHAHHVTASARACGLTLPVTHHTLAQSWHLRADAWWVGTALHAAERATP